MTIIALEGMEFYAHHGYYAKERKLGNYFSVDVWLNARVDESQTSDKLADTVNYESVYEVCQQIMQRPSSLLEYIAAGIADGLIGLDGRLSKVKVRVTKLNPPLPGKVAKSYVEIERTKP